ncbi:DNA packaging protein [Clostridium botulinum]
MIVTLEEVKMYCRIDDDEEDFLLELLIKNAEDYIEDAVKPISNMSDKLKEKSKLLALVLISDWYDNRSLNMKTSEKVRYSITSLLNQMKWCDN